MSKDRRGRKIKRWRLINYKTKVLGGEDGGANGVLRHAQSRLVATEEEEEMEEE